MYSDPSNFKTWLRACCQSRKYCGSRKVPRKNIFVSMFLFKWLRMFFVLWHFFYPSLTRHQYILHFALPGASSVVRFLTYLRIVSCGWNKAVALARLIFMHISGSVAFSLSRLTSVIPLCFKSHWL